MDIPGLAALVDLVRTGEAAVLTGAGMSTDSPTDSRTKRAR
jgi:NAD-dependent SIR2 family protein deacetylase